MAKAWQLSSILFVLAAAACPAAPASASGRIVVANDDWTLSNTGFAQSPSAAQFARNVANWFTEMKPGRFLVRSDNFALTGSMLSATMFNAGHEWIVNPAALDNNVTDLLGYDAIFLCQTPTNMATLIAYVRAGGCVYLAAGSPSDATAWDSFLSAFGLDLGSLNGLIGNASIMSSHPLFQGVTSLYHDGGNDVFDLEGANPANQVLVASGAHGLYGIYDGGGRGCGRIVLANDDWTLSNTGFTNAPTTPQFARNVANWFTENKPGKFLVRSNNFALTGPSLSSTMTTAGHTWTIDAAAPDNNVAALLQYDGVFLCQTPTNIATLKAYVEAGGCVYLAAGSPNDATAWDLFLSEFGLDLGGLNGLPLGNTAISSSHPLFQGVTSLYHDGGNDVFDIGGASATSQVLVASGGHGLYGVYDACNCGHIVIANDDWTLSNAGITNSPTAAQFARNVANWFTGMKPGNFLVRSDNFALTGSTLSTIMTSAGHTWHVDALAPDNTAADLLPYDAVFLCQNTTQLSTLTDYVNAGGSVYLGAGGPLDANAWDSFLSPFGLDIGGLNTIVGNVPIANSHPLFQGVTSLYQENGADVFDLQTSNSDNLVLVSNAGHGLYGTYDPCGEVRPVGIVPLLEPWGVLVLSCLLLVSGGLLTRRYVAQR